MHADDLLLFERDLRLRYWRLAGLCQQDAIARCQDFERVGLEGVDAVVDDPEDIEQANELKLVGAQCADIHHERDRLSTEYLDAIVEEVQQLVGQVLMV